MQAQARAQEQELDTAQIVSEIDAARRTTSLIML